MLATANDVGADGLATGFAWPARGKATSERRATTRADERMLNSE
jgi:hypothetical protein